MVSEASAEARRPLIYATLIVLLAIVPAAVLGGTPRRVLDTSGPRPTSLAVAAAMLVALTVTPALTVLLFAHWQPTATHLTHAAERFGRAT